MSPRIDRVVTSGQFCLDGGCWDVDNNIWLIGDDTTIGAEPRGVDRSRQLSCQIAEAADATESAAADRF